MTNASQLKEEIASALSTQWKRRAGLVLPTTESVKLSNDAVEIDGTVLYADLVDSTDLVKSYKDWFAAEIYKTYLHVACRIIRNNGGEVTAFDGDRVMAVYLGEMKNSSAAKTGLQLNWAIKSLLNPMIQKEYPKTTYSVQHVVGIDTGKMLVARTGIRGSNDLVWVGTAANYAAKLCAQREGTFATIITDRVYARLSTATKRGGSPKVSMWEKTTWQEEGLSIHRSNWWWAIP